MRKYFFIGIISAFIISCTNNYYAAGKKLSAEKNHVSAIEQYDLSIKKDLNGARKTKAEIARSESYYLLGKKAFEKENWPLATRLFFLSNSPVADTLLDNCYYQLSEKSFAEQDTSVTLDFYNKIITYLPDSELVPEIYNKRIRIYLSQNKLDLALEDFKQLWEKYHNDEYTKNIHPKIDEIIPIVTEKIIKNRDNEGLLDSIDKLKTLVEYSINHSDFVNLKIALTYTKLAEIELEAQNFTKAYQYFLSSFEFNQELAEKNQARIATITDGFITKGDDFLKNLLFTEAIESYKKCFLIEKEYQPAKEKIAYAIKREKDAKEAKIIFAEALNDERNNNYKTALKKYLESKKLLNNAEVKRKIFEMKNLIRAKKEPRSFAKEIVLNYKKGKLANQVYAIEDSMLTKYGKTVVDVSGWKVLFTTNNLKYDVRYDIISPYENYYFIWKVDLRTREITALNKRSEELLK
jgi:tetratricopeptide (TPR) repeat protein